MAHDTATPALHPSVAGLLRSPAVRSGRDSGEVIVPAWKAVRTLILVAIVIAGVLVLATVWSQSPMSRFDEIRWSGVVRGEADGGRRVLVERTDAVRTSLMIDENGKFYCQESPLYEWVTVP